MAYKRVEILTGSERRRNYTPAEKGKRHERPWVRIVSLDVV
jgi:hypothetical protein